MTSQGSRVIPPTDVLMRVLGNAETIAVVGASSDPAKQANRVPAYLKAQGYRIVPVNPGGGEILGIESVPSLADVEDRVDIVDVFRPASEAPAIATAATEIGAGTLWLQLGISSPEAAGIARAAGLTVVMDACIAAVHRKLVRRGGLEQRRPAARPDQGSE